MTTALVWLGCLAAFLATYEFLRRREARRTGTRPPVQWRFLVAGIGCAAAATAYGFAADA
jgi:hypothetical protein